MQLEHLIAQAGIGFLVVNGALMVGSVRKGRELCRSLAKRLPERYEELGSPLPGYLDTPRRDAYLRFVMQRSFLELPDPHLVAEFTRRRRAEIAQLRFLLVGFAGLGLAVVWLKHFQPTG